MGPVARDQRLPDRIARTSVSSFSFKQTLMLKTRCVGVGIFCDVPDLTLFPASMDSEQSNLLLLRHVVELIPRRNSALLEYLSLQIRRFSDTMRVDALALRIFDPVCSAVFRVEPTNSIWNWFSLLITYHDRVFKVKFLPLSNSMTLPPPISLTEVAQLASSQVADACSSIETASFPAKRKVAILALDGGGMRGLIEIKILSTLAKKLFGDADEKGTRQLLSKFDIVAGTSTGGIIALALQKMSLNQVREFYLSMGKQIFQSSYIYGIGRWFRYYRTGDYYSGTTLAELFRKEFGDATLAQIAAKSPSNPKLFLAATNATNAIWEPFVLRSYTNEKSIIPGATDVLITDALRATSAAPTYFSAVSVGVLPPQGSQSAPKPVETVQLVDGGMTANNPTELAIFEAHHLELPIGLIVSVGTGMPGKAPGSVNVFKMLNELIDICTSSNAIHLRVLEWIEMMPNPKPAYFRFNPCDGEGSYALDESNDAVLAALEASTEKYMATDETQAMIDQLEACLRET